jgi:tRNA (guanine37-N1)-methyltransferase
VVFIFLTPIIMLCFEIITTQPEAFGYLNTSILGRAQKRGLIKIKIHNLHDYANDKYGSVDDAPYGGGPGMVLKIEPIYKVLKKIIPRKSKKTLVLLMSAKGKVFNQGLARDWQRYNKIVLICGRYEGVDERVAQYLADKEISVGEFVLTGGELGAMIIIDAVARLLPGVLGAEESLNEESFSRLGYLEYPQYTRPEIFKGFKVPEVLLSGDHKKIAQWKQKAAYQPE